MPTAFTREQILRGLCVIATKDFAGELQGPRVARGFWAVLGAHALWLYDTHNHPDGGSQTGPEVLSYLDMTSYLTVRKLEHDVEPPFHQEFDAINQALPAHLRWKPWPKPIEAQESRGAMLRIREHLRERQKLRDWPHSVGFDAEAHLALKIFDPVEHDPVEHDPIKAFWTQVMSGQRKKIVFGSEQPWLGRHDDRHLYSGVGEVAAAYLLGRTLASLQIDCDILPSPQLIAKDRDDAHVSIVFIGNSVANVSLRLLEETKWMQQRRRQTFRFDREEWTVRVEQNGKRWSYETTDAAKHKDYGLVSLIRPPHRPTSSYLLVGGVSTLATLGCMQFLTNPNHVKEVFRRLKLNANQPLGEFDLLLSVVCNRDWPTEEIDLLYPEPTAQTNDLAKEVSGNV